MRGGPYSRSCVFHQAKIKCPFSNYLLQRAGSLAERLHLIAGRRAGRVTGQA
jgi:hypothetical protein